jgi:hypothetical protein
MLVNDEETLGLARHIGDYHYRAYIGPPGEYDLVSATSFGLLTGCGLRQHHKLLDIGCDSLRLGRLLIPYLNAENHIGLEPNNWLIDDGIRNEVGASLVEKRSPTFVIAERMESLASDLQFDYAIAQSIFSHTVPDLLERWIQDVSFRLSEQGVLLATVLEGEVECECESNGWIYPECVEYLIETMAAIVQKYGLEFEVLSWYHPRKDWWAVFRQGFDRKLLNGGAPSWNHFGFLRTQASYSRYGVQSA